MTGRAERIKLVETTITMVAETLSDVRLALRAALAEVEQLRPGYEAGIVPQREWDRAVDYASDRAASEKFGEFLLKNRLARLAELMVPQSAAL